MKVAGWAAAAGAWSFALGAGVGMGMPVEASTVASTVVKPAPPVAWQLFREPVDKVDRVPEGPWNPPVPAPKPWEFTLRASPWSDAPQGVGTIITVRFSEPVPEKVRWKVADSLWLESSDVNQDLSAPWVWLDASTLAWRPKDFWRPHQTVVVKSLWDEDKPLIVVPPSGGRKTKAKDRVAVTFTDTLRLRIVIGADQRFAVDGSTHQGVVTRDGQAVKEVPVSLGMPGHETYSGIKTFMESYEEKRLYNPGQWDVTVPYAIRLTLSGEFLHSAPWNGSIGVANLSHGCTNLSIEDAHWLYDNIQRGDPAIYVTDGGVAPAWDGDGAGWNTPWSQWKSTAAVAP